MKKIHTKIRNILTEHMQIDEFLVIFEIKKLFLLYFLIYLEQKWALKLPEKIEKKYLTYRD